MKTKDWSKLPTFPVPKERTRPEYSSKQPPWVDPATFFDELPTVMKQVSPMPGEEALYKLIGSVLDAAAKDPEVMKTLRETAFAADKELIAPMMWWRYNGQPAGNGWTSPANNAAFGTDYYHRTGAVKADPYDNKRNETMYFYTDNDTQLHQLDGKSSYEITFPKGQLPPVKGFWSLTMYNPGHFFAPNALKRYALGTKNKSLRYNDDGSLTIYLGNKSQEKRRNRTGSPHLKETFPSGSVPIGPTKASSTALGSRRSSRSQTNVRSSLMARHAPMDGRSNNLEPCCHPAALIGWPARRRTTAAAWVARRSRPDGAAQEAMARCQLRWHGRWRRHRVGDDHPRWRRSARGRGCAAPPMAGCRIEGVGAGAADRGDDSR